MKIIHRYLLRQFAVTFIMTFLCLVGMMIVADFVGHLSEFMDRADSGTSLGGLMLSYYGARIPWFWDMSARIIALLAAVFVLGWMQKYHELTALQAAGISRKQIVRPLFAATVVLAILGAANREWGIPRFQSQLCRRASDFTGARAQDMEMRYDPETDLLFDGKAVYPKEQRIQEVQIRLPLAWGGVTTLHAKRAYFREANHDHPSGYLLQEVRPAEQLARTEPLRAGDRILIFPPSSTSWLKPNECFVYSRLPVEAFQSGRRWQQFASTGDLIRGIQDGRFDFSTDARTTIHARFIQPFLDFVLVLLGVPLAFVSSRGQIFAATARNLLVIAGFSVVVVGAQALGIQGITSPALAAWIPLIILAPIAVLGAGPLNR